MTVATVPPPLAGSTGRGSNSHGGTSPFPTVRKPPFRMSSPRHFPERGVEVGVGGGLMRQEHPDETLEAAYCDT